MWCYCSVYILQVSTEEKFLPTDMIFMNKTDTYQFAFLQCLLYNRQVATSSRVSLWSGDEIYQNVAFHFVLRSRLGGRVLSAVFDDF